MRCSFDMILLSTQNIAHQCAREVLSMKRHAFLRPLLAYNMSLMDFNQTCTKAAKVHRINDKILVNLT